MNIINFIGILIIVLVVLGIILGRLAVERGVMILAAIVVVIVALHFLTPGLS